MTLRPQACHAEPGPAPEDFRPVFVMGCSRSGTTMLTVMLDRHSQFVGLPETHYFPLNYLRHPAAANPGVLLGHLDRNPRMADLGLDRVALQAALGAGPASHARLLQVMLAQYAARHGKPFAVEKTPYHLPFTPLILDWYPQARCACIIRDGRDVVLSLKRAGWGYKSIYLNSLRWCYAAALAEQFARRYPGHFYVIRYEDILDDPRTALSGLMAFLGAAFEERQLEASASTGVVPPWESAWKQQALQVIDRSHAGRWRQEATGRELGIMQAVMGDYLRRFRYDPAPASFAWRLSALGTGPMSCLAFSPLFYRLWSRLGIADHRPKFLTPAV